MPPDFSAFFIKQRKLINQQYGSIFSGMQIYADRILDEIPIYMGKG